MAIEKDPETLVVGSASANEILDVLLLTLAEYPDRADLWMMRFDILRTSGLKADFARAMADCYSRKRLRKDIDWKSVRQMWDELAPGEPPPEGVVLPEPAAAAGKGPSGTRRFSDVAMQVAGAELQKLTQDYQALRARPDFFSEFARATRQVLKRPTPLHHAVALQGEPGGTARIFFKREDQHDETAETEIAAAQAHIAVMLGKTTIITGNDVDAFSLALVRVAPHYRLKTTVVVAHSDSEQKPELLAQLRDLGAAVEIANESEQKGKDPREGALRQWMRSQNDSHLALSFGTGPDPYPRMVNDFQLLLGYESDLQLRAKGGADRPRTLVAAVRSEADSIGFMLPYLKRPEVDLFYAEPESAESMRGKSNSRLRAYQGGRREHAWLRATGRISYLPIPDSMTQAIQAQVLAVEGISVGLEDARAVALACGLIQGDAGTRDVVVLLGRRTQDGP